MTDLSGNYEYDCQAELNRKTFEALEALQHNFDTGRISAMEFKGALHGIDLCTRGLVPETYSLAIDNEISLLPAKDSKTAVWASSGGVYVLSMTIGDDFFVVRTIPAGDGKKVIRGEGTDTVASAVEKFRLFERKLDAAGYKQL